MMSASGRDRRRMPASDRPAIIVAEQLSRSFDDLVAVDHLDLRIAEGEIFGLVGPDGAGKTTTLRLLSGLMSPTRGSALVAGHDVERETEAVKDEIGYMAQRFALYEDLTVAENLRFYADVFGLSEAQRKERSSRLLQMTRMEEFQTRRTGKLSGGMKQKLALMCTLLHRPRILLLDEPTNGVDPVSRRDFWAILYQLVREGITVLITTAYLDEAERCNRVGLMYRGSLIRCDLPNVLRHSLEEECLEVEGNSSELRQAREVLKTVAGVLSVEPSGSTLHLFLDSRITSPGRLQERVGEAGLQGLQFRSIIPSLEDVFIALVSRQEGRAQGVASAEVPPGAGETH